MATIYSPLINKLLALAFIILLASFGSCKKEPDPPGTDPDKDTAYDPTPYEMKIPKGFPPMPANPENPMTEEGVKLGRMLYYDDVLSTSGTRCASCHHAERSYSTPFGPGGLSVPPHINLGWNSDFTWNGFEEELDHVAIIDLDVPDFIQPNLDSIYDRFERDQEYFKLFKQAFNVDITKLPEDEFKLTISNALGQFMRTMISSNSKYDRVRQQQDFFTDSEMRGYDIFFSEKGDCFHCHGSVLFTNNTFNNTGLDSVHTGIDQGRFLVTGNPADMGKFSSPTLRNIELTAPYMHDGRFEDLEEVIAFYNSGVLPSPTLDPIMTKPGKEKGLQLTEQDKQDLIAFLKTLTDKSFLTDPDIADPFK